LFLVLIEKFDQKYNFQPGVARTYLQEPILAQTGRKNCFQELRVVLYSFHEKLLIIKLFSRLN